VFASHKRPGGGYKNHEKGQEEFIARRTNLVDRLQPFLHLYGDNFKPFYILLKDVKISGTNLLRDFIVSHAPVARLHNDPNSVMEERIKVVCKKVAYYPIFITGAWGCGFFGNDITKVEKWFKQYATNEKVVWAIK
jgi:uncharacterized protein (TIGR02452 family)